MLKITPYLSILVVIVSIGGIFYPKLGYFLLLVFATLLLISPFKGRWFCGNLCPRGSFHDFWLKPISRKKKIHPSFRSFWLRVPVLILMMGFMLFRIIQTKGVVDKIGMVFVTLCLVSTTISALLGVFISPRAWCSFCPMGTMQHWLGKNKHILKLDKTKCTKCKICHKVCPMDLSVSEIGHDPDCIKCRRCVEACPKKALSFN